jgi:mycothiol synthase
VSLPEGYAFRPAAWADLDDVVELFRACDRADAGVEDPVREHIEDDWRRQGFDLERDAGIVVSADRAIAAYAIAFGLNPELSVEAFVRVHPEHRARGLGSALIAWTEARARETVLPGGVSKVQNSVPAEDEGAGRLLSGCGYGQVRTFWHMERRLAGSLERAVAPAGIELRTYRHETDADAVYDAIEEAFVDHWGYEPYPRATHMEEIRRYDPGLVLLAVDGEQVVGVLMAKTVEGLGWVDVVAVRRPWRGRGIARALLLRSFAALADRHADSVTLNVDSESRTGAPRLYASVGMSVRRAWNVFEKPLSADVS